MISRAPPPLTPAPSNRISATVARGFGKRKLTASCSARICAACSLLAGSLSPPCASPPLSPCPEDEDDEEEEEEEEEAEGVVGSVCRTKSGGRGPSHSTPQNACQQHRKLRGLVTLCGARRGAAGRARLEPW